MTAKTRAILLAAMFLPQAFGQTGKTSGAREYFFLGVQKKDSLPAAKPVPAPHKSQVKKATASVGAVHLGLRYNLLLVDAGTGKWRIVDPDRQFKAGECFAIQLSSNRSGYLYVLAKQSSGTWMPLFPSAKMVGESSVIDPGQTVKIPKDYCFNIENPPGDEELFVALTRDPTESYELQHSIEGSSSPAAAPKSTAPSALDPEATEMADARSMNTEVAQLSERFANRDIAIVKTGTDTASAAEPPHAVYVVNQSAKPTSSLVTRIVVHHR